MLSVVQADVIYYGANLADYFKREFGSPRGGISEPVKHIRFWSELVERNR